MSKNSKEQTNPALDQGSLIELEISKEKIKICYEYLLKKYDGKTWLPPKQAFEALGLKNVQSYYSLFRKNSNNPIALKLKSKNQTKGRHCPTMVIAEINAGE